MTFSTTKLFGLGYPANGFFSPSRDLLFSHPLPTGYLMHHIGGGDFSG
jgi:hypothetical protein